LIPIQYGVATPHEAFASPSLALVAAWADPGGPLTRSFPPLLLPPPGNLSSLGCFMGPFGSSATAVALRLPKGASRTRVSASLLLFPIRFATLYFFFALFFLESLDRELWKGSSGFFCQAGVLDTTSTKGVVFPAFIFLLPLLSRS